MKKVLLGFALVTLLAAVPALAQDPSADLLAQQTQELRDAMTGSLNAAAANLGLALDPSPPSISTSSEASAALIPIFNIGYLRRIDLVTWTPVAILAASHTLDPINDGVPEVAAGTYTVEVQAPANSTIGEFRIVDQDGAIVMQGDMTVTEEPNEEPSAAPQQPASMEGTPVSVDENGLLTPLHSHAHHLGCPWYYPYLRPFYFRHYPTYKHGCHVWHYRWWWGKLHFRYCWFPSRHCHQCCW